MLRTLSITITKARCATQRAFSTLPARAIVSLPTPTGASHMNWSLDEIQVKTDLKPHELLVEMKAVGLCHIDLTIGYKITAPTVLGHEGAGIVKAVGSGVTAARVGDPILLSFNHNARTVSCKKGSVANKTTHFTTAYGSPISGKLSGQSSFSSLSVADESCVINVKNLGLSDKELVHMAPLGCDIQTGAGSMFIQGAIQPHHSAAVYGLDVVGLSGVMGAKKAGAKIIIAVDADDRKLKIAKSFGATHVIKAGDDDEVHAKIMGITGKGTDVSLEATGGSQFVSNAVRNSSPGGKVLVEGLKSLEEELRIHSSSVLSKGITLHDAAEGSSKPRSFIPQMIGWYKNGTFPADKMVKLYKIEDFQMALEDMREGRVIKPVLTF